MRRACSLGPVEAFVSPGYVTEPAPVPGLDSVIDVALGAERTCALRRGGALWCSTDPRDAARHEPETALGGAKQLAVFWPGKQGHVWRLPGRGAALRRDERPRPARR